MWEVLEKAWARVGFEQVISDEAFKQLVLARIVEPTSMLDEGRVSKEIGVKPVHLSTMKRCLARINNEGYREEIGRACFECSCKTTGLALLLYDVTTLYFEAEKEDENWVLTAAQPVWDKQDTTRWRAVCQYSTKRFVRDNKTLNLQEERAKAVVEGNRQVKTTRFVKTDKKTLDRERIENLRQLAGLKGYVTNIEEHIMPAAEVISCYHDLCHVEQSFRMSKTDLKARPIFLSH